MQLFRLHIENRTSYVQSTEERLRAAMYAHIRQELAKGRSLASIEYCWAPIQQGRV